MIELTVFVASPGDVADERRALQTVVDRLNASAAADRGVTLRLVRWETDVRPAMGSRPQAVVNRQAGPMRAHAMFIGIMWSRFGTPTGIAESGTEEEFNAAYSAFEETGQPEIMFYFCEKPRPVGGTTASQQALRVDQFREKIQQLGIVGTFTDTADFEGKVQHHLEMWLLGQTPPTPTVGAPTASPPNSAIPGEQSGQRARAADSGMWVFLDGSFFLADEVNREGDNLISIKVPANTSEDDSTAQAASQVKGQVAFAHANNAAIVSVAKSERKSTKDGTWWQLELRVEDSLEGDSSSEMGTDKYNADQVAELRARRILLNENPIKGRGGAYLEHEWDVAFINSIVSGISTPLKAERGVIPTLAENVDPSDGRFLALARLLAVLFLRGSLAVGSVSTLALERVNEDEVEIEFVGIRPKIYSNVAPPLINITGRCRIRD